jgi:2-C-methyl-D-erythritol 4-phosphate cytidylyltransferase
MSNKVWLLVPAAGVGSRMQADRPKQYLSLLDRPIIEHTLERLISALPDANVVLCLNPEDPYWPQTRFAQETVFSQLQVVAGGKERCDTVLNGLKAIAKQADDDDWVLVHDVARPCVQIDDIHTLIERLSDDPVGGILALPVADTMKRTRSAQSDADNTDDSVDDDSTYDDSTYGDSTYDIPRIDQTVDRNQLWHALTPQMFRYGLLVKSLSQALEQNITITDEASALEWAGYQPGLVCGQRDNIKVTHPDDLYFAELYLKAQKESLI